MGALILSILGFILFWMIAIPLFFAGSFAMSPHSRSCRCSHCQQRIDKAQERHDRLFPRIPGEVYKTEAEWEAWEKEHDA